MPKKPEFDWQHAVGNFIRALSHDVRNDLNAINVQISALLLDHPELKEEARSLFLQIHHTTQSLRNLSAAFKQPARASPMTIPASLLFERWKEEAASLGITGIEWADQSGDAKIHVDFTAMSEVLRELLQNARQFSASKKWRARIFTEDDAVHLELREKKSEPVDPALWGRVPFFSSEQKNYGLGLWRAHRTLRAERGNIVHRYSPETGELVTRICLPAFREAEN